MKVRNECVRVLQVQKAEVVVAVGHKLSAFGQTLRDELSMAQGVHCHVTYDGLLEQVRQSLTQIGEFKLEKYVLIFV